MRTSGTTQSSNTKKVDSTENIVDDLTSIFSGTILVEMEIQFT